MAAAPTPIPTPTAAQRAAIEARLGPVLVLAGPGAGKTFCLIGRVGYLIRYRGFFPERICAVTFTNRAAEEIATRLAGTLDSKADAVHRGTLHALCVEILREHGGHLGIEKGFGIADDMYQRLILRRLGVRRDRWGQLLILFSRRRLQDYGLTAKDEDLLRRYGAHLRRRNLLDFDDLIARTAELFRRHPTVAGRVAGRWEYVLVDEFQDLDPTQYAILKALVASHGNFFAVGDDEQSIFSWRGADPKVLKRFADDFEISDPIVLDRNRRCSTQIFEAARRLLEVEPALFRKSLRADRRSAFEVGAYTFVDEAEESAWIMGDICADRAAQLLGWGDYAVLYRTHAVGNALEGAFVAAGIPCRLARGRALQDDPVVGYVVAALKLMRQPDDPLLVEAFAEVVLPEQLVERVRRGMRDGGGDFVSVLREFARRNPRPDPDTKKAWRFIYHVENLAATYLMHDTVIGIVEELLAQRVGPYSNVLEERHDELSDSAEWEEARELAEELAGAMDGRKRVWVDGAGGVQIALCGMLRQAGVSSAAYLTAAEPVGEEDVLVRTDPLTLFKALQLVHAREFGREFEDYVAFDLETTGRDVTQCEVVEIAAAKVRGGRIIDRFHSLVKPAVPISAGATAVHGYTETDVKDAPPFAEIWPRFREFVGGHLLVAHNGQGFDVPVLKRMTAGLTGIDDMVFYDSLLLARALYRLGARLEDLAHRFGIEMGRAHHALDDAVTLAHVFGELGRQKVVRARKAALVDVLDYLGLGLALDHEADLSEEGKMLQQAGAVYALGRYSECLEFYTAERRRLGFSDLPSEDRVIELLGGRRLMDRLRAERSAEQRYPEAYARLRAILDTSRAATLEESVARLLEHVALSTSEGAEADPNRINLLTLHATKGLEFSRVYIVGVEDFQLPGYYQTVDNRRDEIEEARRLLYVGMTRAEDRLVLTRVDRRAGRDAGGSRFLDDMGLQAVRPPSLGG